MTPLKRAALAAGVFLIALPAGAQMFGRPQIPSGIFNPAVGAGAVYETQPQGEPKRTLEVAIVGKETVDGADGYWIEVTMSGTPMGDVVAKVLNVMKGGRMVTHKMIMQMPGHPPMEMPSQMTSANGGVNFADIRNKAHDLGTESVTTPAGTFTCHHYKANDGTDDAWVSESVRPFGLVKDQDKDSTTILVKTLTGVKDKITGTPVPFNPMMLMPSRAN